MLQIADLSAAAFVPGASGDGVNAPIWLIVLAVATAAVIAAFKFWKDRD